LVGREGIGQQQVRAQKDLIWVTAALGSRKITTNKNVLGRAYEEEDMVTGVAILKQNGGQSEKKPRKSRP